MKKNRSYKKGEAFRDSSLIVIACEGEKTEPNYFSFFEQLHPRKCRVEVLTNDDGNIPHRSAPKWLFEKIIKYIESNEIGENDFLFIVSDVDRWKIETLHEINQFCLSTTNTFFIISNPCFEVWLYYHIGNPKTVNAKTSKQWKSALHEKTVNGFTFEKYINNISKAINLAERQDLTPIHFFPQAKHSKVYQIIQIMIDKVGQPYFNNFINSFDV